MARKYTGEDLNRIKADYRELLAGSAFAYLVVDPSVAARQTAVNALRQIGCETILEGKLGVLALTQLTKTALPVVALLAEDVGDMPFAEFVKKLREKSPQARAILVTSETRQDLLAAAVKAGAEAVLPKPVNAETLGAKLRQLEAF